MSSDQLAQETIAPNEDFYFDDLAKRLQAKIAADYPTGTMRRDAHPKMHGLVKAQFIVEENLPSQLQVGIFKQANSWPCWVRFSNQNATMQDDIKGDIRGMAIKLMGVPGEKLLPGQAHELTQDFITISTNVFITRTPEEFDDLVKALTGGVVGMLWFFISHPHATINLLRASRKFANPLQIQYFSTTPYLFGATAVKYSLRPQIKGQPDQLPLHPTPDFMRAAMKAQLDKEEACFDFLVQLQTDARLMPIEDPSIEWDEKLSPFRKVATLKIPKQEFDSDKQNQFGENLSFTPWHCLPEHRPLGGVNRARKVVYDFISRFRHQKNGVPRQEPTSFEID